MNLKCFLIEPTGFSIVTLRRYYRHGKDEDTTDLCKLMPGKYSYHNNRGPELGEFKEIIENGTVTGYQGLATVSHDDPRWPTHCECGYEFTPNDYFQMSAHSLYRRQDNGELVTLNDAPEGSIWRATWYEDCKAWCGNDGRAYICKLPGGHDWHIDGRASNCDKPHDKEHKCWCRHGEAPNFTVDKVGLTCNAGAGSIISSSGWHGFLRNGVLEQC
jgi:hypothetical protein